LESVSKFLLMVCRNNPPKKKRAIGMTGTKAFGSTGVDFQIFRI
jgi:hypothetical protein